MFNAGQVKGRTPDVHLSGKQLADKLDPHLLKHVKLPHIAPIYTVAARELFIAERFDLAAKLHYARTVIGRKISTWAKEMYRAHIETFNGGKEPGNDSKNSLDAFVEVYDHLLETIANQGFSNNISVIPVSRSGIILDGSHRVAACAALKVPLQIVFLDTPGWGYDYGFFKNRGLAPIYADAMATELVHFLPEMRLAFLFPAALGADGRRKAFEILSKNSQIFYVKDTALNQSGAHRLMTQIYKGEAWVGNWNDNFSGAADKARLCFPRGGGTIRVVAFVPKPGVDLVALKREIRDLFNVSNHSIHITDSHREALELSRPIFNANSIHHLNTSRLKKLPRFIKLTESLSREPKFQQNVESICLSGSATLAAYGLRDCADLDYVSVNGSLDLINADYHGSERSFYPHGLEEIPNNPNWHFYWDNMKFCSLQICHDFKALRRELKDLADIQLMQDCLPKLGMEPGATGEQKPLLSIIMASNGEANLSESVASVIAQTSLSWELIIVHYAHVKGVTIQHAKDQRIRILQSPDGFNYGQALKLGVDQASARLFGFLEAGDLLLPDAVATAIEAHHLHQKAACIYSQFAYCDAQLNLLRLGTNTRLVNSLSADQIYGFITCKKGSYNKTEGIDAEAVCQEMQDLLFRMEEVGGLVFIDDVKYLRRMSESSVMKNSYMERIKALSLKRARWKAVQRRYRAGLLKITGVNAELGLEDFSGLFPCLDLRPNNDFISTFGFLIMESKQEELEQIIQKLLEKTANRHEILVADCLEGDEVSEELLDLPIFYTRLPADLPSGLVKKILESKARTKRIKWL